MHFLTEIILYTLHLSFKYLGAFFWTRTGSEQRPISYHAVFFDTPRQDVSRAWIMNDKISPFKGAKVQAWYKYICLQGCIIFSKLPPPPPKNPKKILEKN